MTTKNHGFIKLSHKDLIDSYLAKYPPKISEHTFTNLFIWRSGRPIKIIEANDSLLIIEERDNYSILFGNPIGDINFKDAFETAENILGKPCIACTRSNEKSKELLNEEDRNNFDYVYYQKDLSELSGRKYHKKRNLISQAKSLYNANYEKINKDHIFELKNMQSEWCEIRECGIKKTLCHENHALMEILENFEALKVIGAALRIEGKIQAFTFGERLNENTAVIHFEKAMPEFTGIYQLINQEFIKNEFSNFELINREQDIGISGLRHAKESYFPLHMIEKYIIYINEDAKKHDINKNYAECHKH